MLLMQAAQRFGKGIGQGLAAGRGEVVQSPSRKGEKLVRLCHHIGWDESQLGISRTFRANGD
jgi:hypothetical protein